MEFKGKQNGGNEVMLPMPEIEKAFTGESENPKGFARSSTLKETTSPKPDKPLVSRGESLVESKSILSSSNNTPRTTGDLEVIKKLGSWIFSVIVKWVAFVCLLGCFVATLTVHKFGNHLIWGLELWKWFLLVFLIFSIRLLTRFATYVVLFLIESMFLLNETTWYVVFGLKKSFQFFMQLCLVLLAWILLVEIGVVRSNETTRVLIHLITRGLASSLLGAFLWLLKVLLFKIVAANIEGKRYFDRIKKSIFHQLVVEVLSRPPSGDKTSTSKKIFELLGKERSRREQQQNWLYKLKQEKAFTWTMKRLYYVAEGGNFKIRSETEAREAAKRIFKKVAKPYIKDHHSQELIKEEDLLSYFNKEVVKDVFSLFEVAPGSSGEITEKDFKNFLERGFWKHEDLRRSINEIRAMIEAMNNVASVIVLSLIVIVWLLMMRVLSGQTVALIFSQVFVLSFVFGNTAKSAFEGFIFTLVVHPFEVGDRCVIDGIQMIVEEINLLTTVFLGKDNGKILYPNSDLATKSIKNFHTNMCDSVEFLVDVSTSIAQVEALKDKVKKYLESSTDECGQFDHSTVRVNGFEDATKIKMAVYHTMSFRNHGEKCRMKSDLVLELKKILEEVGIYAYHFLPQEVHPRITELLWENKRMLDKSIVEIGRERQGLQAQEKNLIAEIQKLAMEVQTEAVKVKAKDLIRTKHQIEKFYKLISQLQGVSLRIQTLKSTQEMGEAMKGVAKAIGQMNMPSLQKIIQEFERQNEKMEMVTRVMGDAIDDSLKVDEEKEETDELVKQVLDKIGIHINHQNAPSSIVCSCTRREGKVAQAEATGNDESGMI